ncbi:uncharacterized protein [Parasteatoda tepidariorum]|uniref:uncharacterized protein n=1 Tax=Parasteatoda tepidariorum TaxID=114398 RepID=UPI001C71C73B|nr:uncharacterized protein LOC107438873 [Parasteatoda tepidariorum]
MAFRKIKSKISQSLVICVMFCIIKTCEAAKELEKSDNADLLVASSVAVNTYKIQSTGSATSGLKKYGYPFLIAPTLNPVISSRSDDDEDTEDIEPIASAKDYGSKLTVSETSEKKSNEKKRKIPYRYGAIRRQGYQDKTDTDEHKARRYKEPKYRNFDELESKFKPRRIDYEAPYSEYYVPSKSSKPKVSQRDPYLSPSSKEPIDTFYPISKTRSYTSPYKQSGRSSAMYGSGRYEDSPPYYGTYSHSSYSDDAYNSPSKYPTNDDPYNYQEDYTIESNKPIIGDIRKRLLDYAGASDLYEGEPDYLRQVALNKHKYAPIGNDYYGYGEPEYKKSYREFPYVESKISLIKKRRIS